MTEADPVVQSAVVTGEATALLAALVRAPSPNPPGDERAATAVARDYLEAIPGVGGPRRGSRDGRPMLIASLRGEAGPVAP